MKINFFWTGVLPSHIFNFGIMLPKMKYFFQFREKLSISGAGFTNSEAWISLSIYLSIHLSSYLASYLAIYLWQTTKLTNYLGCLQHQNQKKRKMCTYHFLLSKIQTEKVYKIMQSISKGVQNHKPQKRSF